MIKKQNVATKRGCMQNKCTESQCTPQQFKKRQITWTSRHNNKGKLSGWSGLDPKVLGKGVIKKCLARSISLLKMHTTIPPELQKKSEDY